MNVSHVMVSGERLKVPPSLTLKEANERMDEVSTSALAIFEGGEYRGLVSRWEIALEALAGKDIGTLRVSQVMKTPPAMDHFDPVELAVDLLIKKVGRALPVMRNGRFEGLVTWEQVDSFVAEILDLEGAPGRIHLAIVNAPGQLARVLRAVAGTGANVSSVILSEPRVLDLCHVVVKVSPEHVKASLQALRDQGFTIID